MESTSRIPPARVLDVGGGAGHQAIPLAQKGYGVTILDPSRTMLQEAGRREPYRSVARLIYVVGYKRPG